MYNLGKGPQQMSKRSGALSSTISQHRIACVQPQLQAYVDKGQASYLTMSDKHPHVATCHCKIRGRRSGTHRISIEEPKRTKPSREPSTNLGMR